MRVAAAAVTVPALIYLFGRFFTSTGYAISVADDGLMFPGKGALKTALIPWRLVREVRISEDSEGGWYLGLLLKGGFFRHLAGNLTQAEAVRMEREIRPYLPTSGAEPERPLTAEDFFELFFNVTLPAGARVTHAEFHAGDRTGHWAVTLSDDALKRLLTEQGRVTAWYPLTSDQRFRVGGMNLVGRRDLDGAYALATQDWDRIPALVWNPEERTLRGLLAESMM